MTPPLAPGEKLGFSPTFFAPQAGWRAATAVPVSGGDALFAPPAPALASQHREGLLCNPGRVPQKRPVV